MTAPAITTKNIRSGKTVKVPNPGRIVSVTYDVVTNYADELRDAKWASKTVIGIVISHGNEWDALDRSNPRVHGSRQPSLVLLTLTGERKRILFSRIEKATSTRAVPAEAREVMTSIYRWETKEEAKWDAKIRRLQEQKKAASISAGAYDVKKSLAAATGALTEEQFLAAVRSRLASRLPAFKAGEWSVSFMGSQLSVWRTIDIQKYYHGPLAYLEYDNTMSLVRDAEQTAEGRSLIYRHRRELPLRAKLNEYLSLGDKDWLTYEEYYILADIDGKLLTEALAEEVVTKAIKA